MQTAAQIKISSTLANGTPVSVAVAAAKARRDVMTRELEVHLAVLHDLTGPDYWATKDRIAELSKALR